MMPFIFSNELIYSFTLLCYLLVAFIGVVCFAMSISYKLKLIYIIPEILISFLSIILFCYFTDGIRVRYFNEDINKFIGTISFMPTWSVVTLVIMLLICVCVWLVLVIKKRLSSITAMSIKEAIAALSSGLCFYDETGRILLLNEQIDNECQKITGECLYDGISFWSKMCSNKVMSGITITQSEGSVIVECCDGEAICYKRIKHNFNGKTIYEITGTNISKELALKKEIENKNIALRKMNIRLRQYGKSITEVIKEKETLATKIKVHSNLGSLILRTKKSLTEENSNLNELINEWNDILYLIFESSSEENKLYDAEKTAKTVGVDIIYNGKYLIENDIIKNIFGNAVFECVVNTARHADGSKLFVKIEEDSSMFYFTFTNDGKKPTSKVKEGGGLSSIRTMVENIGGKMEVSSFPDFIVSLMIPKEAHNE